MGGCVIEWEQFRLLRPTSDRKGECFLELRYTMTKADLRRQFLALGRTKGSLAYRQLRTGRLLTAAVVLFAEALYAVSLLTREPVVSNATWLALGVLALLLVPLLAIFWVLEPRQFAARQMRELRAVLPAMTTQPYTLQLEAGLLRYSGPGAAGGHGQAECPAADLRAVRADRDGLVVVLGDGSGLLVPRTAFAGPEGPEDWVRALQAAPARPDAAPPADRTPDGFVPEGAGGTFACTLTAEELPRLLWEASRAAMRTPRLLAAEMVRPAGAGAGLRGFLPGDGPLAGAGADGGAGTGVPVGDAPPGAAADPPDGRAGGDPFRARRHAVHRRPGPDAGDSLRGFPAAAADRPQPCPVRPQGQRAAAVPPPGPDRRERGGAACAAARPAQPPARLRTKQGSGAVSAQLANRQTSTVYRARGSDSKNRSAACFSPPPMTLPL